MTIGERIMEIRTQAGLSQEQFAEKLGTTRQSVSRWELDQALPTLEKIVLISRLFSVTTDSILRDNIAAFSNCAEEYCCGVFRSGNREIAVTERFAIVYYKSDNGRFGAKLFSGNVCRKKLCAVCERNDEADITAYSFISEDGRIVSNDESLSRLIGEEFSEELLKGMRRLESFRIDHSHTPLPTVSETGIKNCLLIWRMANTYWAKKDHFHFFMCTGKTEYIFSIRPEDTNIYCGVSYNVPFDLGLFSGGQFFRIRNFQDNSKPYCGFYYDFGYEYVTPQIPTEQVKLGKTVDLNNAMMWCVKRYNDNEIVLQGCGDDEYIYSRNDRVCERIAPIETDKND